jgi:hypothetical protein
MPAERRDALRVGALDREQPPSVGMTRHRCNLDGLAAERVRHIDVLSPGNGDAVAAMTDVIDDETLNHGGRR